MNQFRAHRKPILDLKFFPGKNLLATSSSDESVVLWALDDLSQIDDWTGSFRRWGPIEFSPDGCHLAVGGHGGTQVWVANGNPTPLVNSKEICSSIAFTPDGSALFSFGSHAVMRQWRIPSGAELPCEWGGSHQSSDRQTFPSGALAISPDGKIVAASFGVIAPRRYVSAIWLFAARDGERVGALGPIGTIPHPTRMRFSHDGKLLASIHDSFMRIWDVEARTLLGESRIGTKHLKSCAFVCSTGVLYAVSTDGCIYRWTSADWSRLQSQPLRLGSLTALDIQPHSERLAVGNKRGQVAILDCSELVEWAEPSWM